MSDDNNPFEQQRAAIIEAHILSGYSRERAELIAELSIKTAGAAFMVVEMGCEAGGSIAMSMAIATTTMQLVADHANGFVEAMKSDPKGHVLSALEQGHRDALAAGNDEDAEYLEACLKRARSPECVISMNEVITGFEDAPTKH